jgi:hypothetical protein
MIAAKLRENAVAARSEFAAFLKLMQDVPHGTVEIITGALIFRAEAVNDRLREHLLNRRKRFADGWDDFREDVRLFDDLVRASIETAEFHRELGAIALS